MEERLPAQGPRCPPQGHQAADERQQHRVVPSGVGRGSRAASGRFIRWRAVRPAHPGDRVVLAVGVVVAALRTAEFVAGEQHGHARRQQQRREQRAAGAAPVGQHVRTVGRALHTAVRRVVVSVAVVVPLAVGLVVFVGVGDEVGEGEAVMRGHEVHRGPRPPARVLVQVARPGDPVAEIGHAGSMLGPDRADGVTVAAVPFRPGRGKRADLVAAPADVPWLGNDLYG